MNLSLTELDLRRRILDQIIRENRHDPRVEEPMRQQRLINRALGVKLAEWRRQQGLPEPEPRTVGLQSLRLSGRAAG